MSRPLEGVRVAITENRYPEQLTQLLERQGATVFSCPLLKETPTEDARGAHQFIELCEKQRIDYIIFYTGVGVDFLFKAVNRPDVIARSRILARGPKAVNALKRAGVRVDLVADFATTEGIVGTLSRENLAGKTILVQLYGQDNPALATALEALGARVIAVSLYSYTQASDTEAIGQLVYRVLHGEIDAITFTSATQVPFLFQSAKKLAGGDAFRERLGHGVIVASVGEVTSRALRQEGVEPNVMPEEPKMGPMVKALSEYFGQRSK
jgi:uroporphyrinogen-III synthase